MPAIVPDNLLMLPRVPEPDRLLKSRDVTTIVTAVSLLEGAGFPVRRPFPGRLLPFTAVDPFLLLDHLGPVEYGPGEAKGAPWHPHRGFETVTYMMDGTLVHHDSQGGGGLIADGDTQWMTAGSGILHDEMPPLALVQNGGRFHGVQLWVNLPGRLKMTPPRYQDIAGNRVALLASADGAALIRLIAGELAGYNGPGVTHTPICYAHATVYPGARLRLPWPPSFNAMVYVLSGTGTVGENRHALFAGQLAAFGPGHALDIAADANQASQHSALEILLLGGQPIREPVAQYGPFVMNTHQEIAQAFEDYQQGRLGTIPVIRTPPPTPS
ncbi:MAG: pirin family protein [Thermaerobacter sp.]|nr:pirin family protein [Thermaerobacter sp.]